jgi:MFS transporter, DHA3 family, macrolide efflux protein
MAGKVDLTKSMFITTVRNANFSKLVTAQIISAIGDRINYAALLGFVVYMWGETAKHTANIMFWNTLPRPLVALFAAAMIDRWNRKNTLITSDVARAGVVALIPVALLVSNHYYSVYAMVFVVGVFSAIFVPARQAIMPNLVPSEMLMAANAMTSQAGMIFGLLSMVVAGWLVENLGVNSSFMINAVTYLASAWFLWQLKPSGSPVPAAKAAASAPIDDRPKAGLNRAATDFKDGLTYILSHRAVCAFIIFSSVIYFLMGFFAVSFFTYTVDILGQTVGGTHLLFAILGVGMVVGAAILISKSSRELHFLLPVVMLMAAGVSLWVLSVVFDPWQAAPVLFCIGFCAVMVQVPIDTFIQRNVPDELRGRAFAVKSFFESASFLISLQFSKAFIYHLGVLGVLKGMGILAIGISLPLGYMLYRTRKRG